MATDSSILAWRIPWTEEPSSPIGHQFSSVAQCVRLFATPWTAIVHRVAQSQTQLKCISMHVHKELIDIKGLGLCLAQSKH